MATSHPCLRWHADRQLYELDEQGRKQFFPLTSDEGYWVTWLESISAFSFQGQQGHLKGEALLRFCYPTGILMQRSMLGST